MSRGKVLIADNDASQSAPWQEFLEKHGYEILTAGSPDEARSILDNSWVHLAIVDLRLENDDDERDISGLTLCKETDPVIPRIILTNYPTYEAVRVALGPNLKGLPSAVDFLAKEDGLPALLAAVERAFTTHVRINTELEIEFGGTSFLCMASLMESAPEEGEELILWASELEDLFRKLFHDCTKVTVFPLPFRGHGRAVIVQAKPTDATGDRPHVIVKSGLREDVGRESDNYDNFVSRRNPNWSTRKVEFQETRHFAGAIYAIIGGSLEETERFSDFYKAMPSATISEALTHLFRETSKLWYRGQRRVSGKKLDTLYLEQLSLAKEGEEHELNAWIAYLSKEAPSLGLKELTRDKKGIIFRFSDGTTLTWPDPTSYIYGGSKLWNKAVSCCVSHGDLNANNILVDEKGNTWLIDFERTGCGPVLRDFAELEGVIRWELVRERSLPLVYHFEKALLQPGRLDSKIASGVQLPPDLEKAHEAITVLRHLASEVPGSDIREYYAGLLFYSARMIVSGGITSPGQARPSLVRRAHALLSAAMICYRLEHWDKWEGWPDERTVVHTG